MGKRVTSSKVDGLHYCNNVCTIGIPEGTDYHGEKSMWSLTVNIDLMACNQSFFNEIFVCAV